MSTYRSRPALWKPNVISFESMIKPMLAQFCKRKGIHPPLYRATNIGTEDAPLYIGFVLVEYTEYHGDDAKSSIEEAEQSAARQALLHLNRTDFMHFTIAHLVHNGGLTKNMLEEFAQRMGVALPAYTTTKYTVLWGLSYFVTTIEIGDLKYDGPGMPTKKEAEMNAATFACAQLMYAFPAGAGAAVPPHTAGNP